MMVAITGAAGVVPAAVSWPVAGAVTAVPGSVVA